MKPVGGAQGILTHARRWRVWEPAAALLALALPLLWPSQAPLMSEVAITALFAISLDLVLGYAGIVSLGHAAFFGLGAYAAALWAKHVTPEPLFGLAVGVAAATLTGALCSATVLRGSDLTRLMVTLGAALVLLELANKFDGLTGGADGLQGVALGPLFGHFEFDLGGRTAAYYAIVVLIGVMGLIRRVVHSPFGASLKAIRDNRLRAAAIGVPVHARLVAVYTLGAAIAGLAGALLAQTTSFASLDLFAIDRSADLMLMLVIGGTGWLYGGVVGAVVFKALHTLLSGWTPQYWTFWMGAFLVLIVLVGRERLVRPLSWGRR